MMGQQETRTMVVAEKEAGGALRRTVLALAVAALMALMLVAMAAPAFAGEHKGQVGSNYGSLQNDYNYANLNKGNVTGGDDYNNHGGRRVGESRN